VDLVLVIKVPCDVSPNERKEFFKKLHEQWMNTEGRVLIVSTTRTKCPGDTTKSCTRMGTPLLSWEELEPDILEARFIKQNAYEVYAHSVANQNESFLQLRLPERYRPAH